jgi:hypothetical protein
MFSKILGLLYLLCTEYLQYLFLINVGDRGARSLRTTGKIMVLYTTVTCNPRPAGLMSEACEIFQTQLSFFPYRTKEIFK